jgi:flagellar biosynthetic protein FliO
MGLFLALGAPDLTPLPGSDVGTALRSLLAVFAVLALVAACAWLVRRGAFGSLGRRGQSAVRVETAVPLGDRRSLLVVAVEGRRLLLGATPQQVTLVIELGPASGFAESLDRAASRGSEPSNAAGGRS